MRRPAQRTCLACRSSRRFEDPVLSERAVSMGLPWAHSTPRKRQEPRVFIKKVKARTKKVSYHVHRMTVTRLEFAAKLSSWRRGLGLTAEQIAKELGVSPSAYRNWESAISKPRDPGIYAKLRERGFEVEQVSYTSPRTATLGLHVAEVLLNVIENPDSSAHDKDVAKQTILEAIRTSQR